MPDLNLILGVICAVIIIWQAIRGLGRGTVLQVVHLALCGASAFGAYKIVEYINTSLFADSTTQLATLLEMFESSLPLGEIGINLSDSVSYLSYTESILALPVSVFFSPIIFTLAYLLISSVAQFVYLILKGFIPRGFTSKTKGIGALIGAAEGVLICLILLVPFVAFNNVITDANTYADPNYEAEGNTVLEIADGFGVGALLDDFATITVDDAEVNLTDDAAKVVAIFVKYDKLAPLDTKAPGENEKEFLGFFVDTIGGSPYLATMASSVLSGAGNAMKDNVILFVVPEPYNMLTNVCFEIFATSNKDNLHADLLTMLDVYYLLSDEGIVSALENEGSENAVRDAFLVRDENGATLVDRVTSVISANEHTKPMINAITEISLAVLSESLGLGGTTVKYDDLKSSMNDVLAVDRENYATDEEYVSARNDTLNNTLVNNGITLDESIINDMGDYIDENYAGKSDLTDEEFNDIILSYYEIYEKNFASGTLPDQIPEDLIPQ